MPSHDQKVRVQKGLIRAQFQPESFNSEKNTMDLTWTTGAAYKRYSWTIGPFIEELQVDSKAIRLDRLNSGAPLLDTHQSYNLRSQIGVVEKAWIKDGEGVATVRFSTRPEIQDLVKDIKEGIIRNVSVGYNVNKYEDVTQPDAKIKTLRATDWEPMEISMVPVPADYGAQVRSVEQEQSFEAEIILGNQEINNERNFDMPQKTETTVEPTSTPAPAVDLEQVRKEAAEQAKKEEQVRQVEIRKAVKAGSLDEAFAEQLIKDNKSVDEARAAVLEKLSQSQPAVNTHNIQVGNAETDEKFREAMTTALLHRAGANVELTADARQFRRLRLMGMLEECLRREGKDVKRFTSDTEMVRAGFLSTSDFANILGNAVNKHMRKVWDEAPVTYTPIVREIENPDFKPINAIALSSYPSLEKLPEGGERKRGAMSDTSESYQIETYAKSIGITRKAIVNDDMRFFNQIPRGISLAGRRLVSDLVWGIFTANTLMADGNNLFHTAHKNISTSTATLDNTSLAGMIALMRKQQGLQKEYLNLSPNSLIVPPDREKDALALVASIYASNASSANVFSQSIKNVIVEPRLAAAPFYLASSLDLVDMIEVAYLQGQAGMMTTQAVDPDYDGMTIHASLDVGVAAVDFRGLVKNAGI